MITNLIHKCKAIYIKNVKQFLTGFMDKIGRNTNMTYLNRITDKILQDKMGAFGAVNIVGPKGCGKTTTGKHFSKSYIEFQDEDKRDNYLLIANTQPSDLLIGEKPRLFDEWQDAPKIWGAIRKDIDDNNLVGQYILTGSSSKAVDTPHTGTLRISKLKMYPLSLYESNESNGQISIIDLFNKKDMNSCHSDLTINDIKYVICRGGWPASINAKTKDSSLLIAKDLFNQTYETDISNIDKVKRNPNIAKTILKSYARNICTMADTNTILSDVNATIELSRPSYYDYINALEQLFIIEDIEAWTPNIRSKTSIRSKKKRNFIDPSIATGALGISPEYFNTDYMTLGFLFESLCIRDLKIYTSKFNGSISYYHDRFGLEADAVLHLDDGRYAILEFKLGESEVEKASAHLCKIEQLIDDHNKNNKKSPIRKPDLKIIITATEYGYKRDDEVFVIPIGCLSP